MAKEWRAITVSAGLSWVMKLLMIGLVPYELHSGEYLFAFAAVIAFVISLVPSIAQRSYHVTLPFELDLLITLMIFLHTFLGTALRFYERVWLFDKLLHLYGGAITAMLGFLIVYTLHYTKKLRLTIPLLGFFTVIFAMAMGAFWEIGEFAVDNIFGKHTQPGLVDTMWDMINDLIGGVAAAVLGMLYVRYSKPEARRRLARPLGEIMGLAGRIDRFKDRVGSRGPTQR